MGKSFMSLSIKRVIMYSFLGLLLISFVQCSISLSTAVTMPCDTNDSYCWEDQSEKIQRQYLN